MKRTTMTLAISALALAFAWPGAGEPEKAAGSEMETADWTRWGGPNQDFHAPSGEIADSWPEGGPPKVWSRELGEGYSTILVENGRLYTMYRGDGKEVVASLDAKTGETVWERRYDSSPREGHVTQFGEGPRATPLMVGDRLYTIGVEGRMHCLDKKTGEVHWSHDLWTDFGGNVLPHGYSSSPIAYRDMVIALTGGENQSIVAFNQKDGKVAWKGLSFKNSYATPQIFNIHGQDQLVTFMASELIGVDPTNGELLWRFEHQNQWFQNISPPVLVDDHLFLSSPQIGARGLKLTQKDGKTEVEEVWSTRKIQFYHVTTVRDGDWVYGSTGTFAPAFMAAVNVKTGEIGWRERGFAKANCIGADGHLIILDENGKLYLATATPEELTVHSQAELLEKAAWTAPTLVGTTLYLRDQSKIMALDLS